MKQETYGFEGSRTETADNRFYTGSIGGLRAAIVEGAVCEGVVTRCDSEHNLHIELPCGEGVIPHEQGAEGIAEGRTRDIALLTRVGKPVSFTVKEVWTEPDGFVRARLSRLEAQARCRQERIAHLRPGDILPVRVTHLDTFGAFCDIGCGISALMPIASLSVSRIAHPSDRVAVGQDVFAVVSSVVEGRVTLSMRELLGTWEENAARFTVGETVPGIVRSVESYGVFVELTPNLAGLAELRDLSADDLRSRIGQSAAVYIKSIVHERMKIKLVLIDTCCAESPSRKLPYYIDPAATPHLSHWVYSPSDSRKLIETKFDEMI